MLTQLKTGTKILIAFGFAILVSAFIGGAAWWSERQLSERLADLADNKLVVSDALGDMMEAQAVATRGATAMLLRRGDAAMRREARADAEQGMKALDESIAIYEKAAHDERAVEAWKAAQAPLATWRKAITDLMSIAAERDRLPAGEEKAVAEADARAWAAFQDARKTFGPLGKALDEVAETNNRSTAAAKEAGHRAASTGLWIIGAALAAGALALLVLGLLLSRSIGRILASLVTEAGKVTAAVEAGDLGVRGDPSTVSLEFRPIVSGMNATIEAFVKPIEVTASYVARISRGDIPPKISDAYRGDFEAIKNNLNQCIDAVKALVEEASALSKAAVEGRLSARAEAASHQGDFRRVIQGVNQTLDAVLAPVEEARGVLERLAARDLTARAQGTYQGDHARLVTAVNQTAAALHDSLGQVAEAVEQVSNAAGQIATSSQAVASGASEQASSLEETHSSLETMAAQTRQVAESAGQASALASGTQRSAEDGALALERMTQAMEKIRHSAEGTSAIIRDISEIAFQTNLLALNAAVEAARAGEAGRGFAVVAEEVRSLALRAKEAAVKTEGLIKESVAQAAEGESVARASSDKLVQIVASAQKVSGIVAEMASSAKEQAQGIEQVNRAVGEMDKVTQQNAASSEESSSAAEELNGQAEELAAMVRTFRLGPAGATGGRSAARSGGAPQDGVGPTHGPHPGQVALVRRLRADA